MLRILVSWFKNINMKFVSTVTLCYMSMFSAKSHSSLVYNGGIIDQIFVPLIFKIQVELGKTYIQDFLYYYN